MNELEDEPLDVQLATPVEDEIRRGQTYEVPPKRADGSNLHTCKKERPCEQKLDCCEWKRQQRSQPKTVKMYVFGPECKLDKERVNPYCLTKDEHLNFLATPKEFCPTQCAKVEVTRRVRPITPRIEELARPTKRRLLRTLEDYGASLTAQQLDHLIQYIEGETALTPEQAENIVRDKAASRKLTKKKKKKKTQCPSKSKKPSKKVCEPTIDLEAANCQYTIAQCFVRSILCRTCAHPREEYCDIAEVILQRLSRVLEYEPVGPEDRKSQQMRLLANVFACWIIEILVELSEKNKDKLEEECLKRQQEAEERALMEAELAAAKDDEDDGKEDDDDDDDDRDDDDDDDANGDDDEGLLTAATSLSQADTCRADGSGICADSDSDMNKKENETQYETDDFGAQATETSDEALQCDEDDICEKGDEECIEPCVDEDQQTECNPKFDAECITDADDEYYQMRKLASRMSQSFETDAPFITFAKIFDTLFCMIGAEPENALCDPMDNRIHRAIYEKFERAILLEDPDLLTPKIKDIIDVNAGKIALWIRRTLNAQQIKFLNDNPAEVESKEVRDWSKWMSEVADVGVDQSEWLTKFIDDFKDIRKSKCLTRGQWQDFTRKFDTNALLFRRAYKDAQHKQHHNTMMMTDRIVVKTGEKSKLPRFIDSEECHASGIHEL